MSRVAWNAQLLSGVLKNGVTFFNFVRKNIVFSSSGVQLASWVIPLLLGYRLSTI